MEFSEEQKDIIRGWVKDGDGLSEIQRKLASEMGTTMTYMDVRFLILDLKVDIKEEEDAKPEDSGDKAEAHPDGDSETAADTANAGSGGVSVEVDVLTRPGALLSGTVVFSDGVSAVWVLDQAGRLGIEPSQEGYRPGEEDNAEFVKVLQAEIAKKGF